MKKKYIFLLIAFFILLFASVLCYFMGFYPLMGKNLAKSKISEYTGAEIDTAAYHFPHSCYIVRTKEGKEYKVNFYRKSIFDPVITEADNAIMKEKYDSFVQNNPYDEIIFPTSVQVSTQIDLNDFSKKRHKIFFLGILDSFESTADPDKRISEVVNYFLEYMSDDFFITGMQVTYATLEKDYSIICNKGKKQIYGTNIRDYIEEKSPLVSFDAIPHDWKKKKS